LIVLHTAEGALTYQSLGSFFANPASGVSSHTGIDDQAGVIGEYVRRDYKAWTAANANPYAVQTELCAFAEWDPAEWDRHPNMLANCAAWVAEEAQAFGIPIIRLTPAQAQSGTAGVCQHVDLGPMGGGHWDCGPGFPMDRVLQMAGGVPASPVPLPPTGAGAPPWPGRYFELVDPLMSGADIAQWQAQIAVRGWQLAADGWYGSQSEAVCVQFQDEKGLTVDGVVGPDTWAAAWTAPVT
jgi:peptidoglycan hydrolase-like protein with peptidoglycan-binding domain